MNEEAGDGLQPSNLNLEQSLRRRHDGDLFRLFRLVGTCMFTLNHLGKDLSGLPGLRG